MILSLLKKYSKSFFPWKAAMISVPPLFLMMFLAYRSSEDPYVGPASLVLFYMVLALPLWILKKILVRRSKGTRSETYDVVSMIWWLAATPLFCGAMYMMFMR